MGGAAQALTGRWRIPSEGRTTATRGGTVLPSRGIDRASRFVTRGPARHQIGLGVAVILVAVVLFAAAVVVPKPNITLTNPQYFPGECDTTNETRIVTATFTLTNVGGSSGAMEVNLYADSMTLSDQVLFEVPAHASVRGSLSGIVRDCAPHTYSLSASYASGQL